MSKANAKKSSNDIWYKILAIAIAAIFALGILITVVKTFGLVERISLHTNVTMKSENYSVNNAEMTYLVYSMYNSYYNTYSAYGESYLTSFGLDTSKSLDQQMYMGGSTSWRDFLTESVTDSMKECLALCEAFDADTTITAEKRKEITDEVEQQINDEIDALKEIAKENNVSATKYISQMCFYTKGISISDVKHVMQIQFLASKYSSYVSEGYKFEDTEYDKKYDDNKNDYRYADYKKYEIEADYEDGAADDVVTEAKNKANEAIEAIKKNIESGMSFEDAVYKYEQELEAEKDDDENDDDDDDTEKTDDDDEEEKTEEELKEEIAEKVLKEKQSYSDDEFGKWLFADTAPAVDELKIIIEEDTYTLYQVVKQPYRCEYETGNFHYIAITDGVATDDKSAEDVVKGYLTELEGKLTAGDEAGFLALADGYKDIENCAITLYEKVENLDKDVADSNLSVEGFDEWAFGDDIKAGDFKSFSAEDSSYIFYYTGKGLPAWKADVDSDLREEKYESDLEAWKTAHTVTVNEKAQAKVAK